MELTDPTQSDDREYDNSSPLSSSPDVVIGFSFNSLDFCGPAACISVPIAVSTSGVKRCHCFQVCRRNTAHDVSPVILRLHFLRFSRRLSDTSLLLFVRR